MAIREITKIRILRGDSQNLPINLDAGEFAYTTDSHQVFTGGVEPRSDFPYQNIEILTEDSNALLDHHHGKRIRDGGRSDFHTAIIPVGGWNRVVIDGNEYKIHDISAITMGMTYTVTSNNEPVRSGQMTISYNIESHMKPQVVDEGIKIGEFLIRFKPAGPINGRYIVIETKTPLTNCVMRFQISTVRVPHRDEIDHFNIGRVNSMIHIGIDGSGDV
jgi:hypothetical protein